MPSERIELAKVAERSLDLITENELKRLLESVKGNDLKALRDSAILELLFQPACAFQNSVPSPAILI